MKNIVIFLWIFSLGGLALWYLFKPSGTLEKINERKQEQEKYLKLAKKQNL